MKIVLDANLLVALVVDVERGPIVERHLRQWESAGDSLHAPSLLRYEVANALTRCIAAGQLDASDADTAWERLDGLPIVFHDLDDGPAVIALARRLRRTSAYDAAYVVLATKLGAELRTLDGPLARNAATFGLPVFLIEKDEDVPLRAPVMDPENLDRARELADRLDRRDDYGRLLYRGEVIRSVEDIDDVDAWRAEIRRKARADRLSVSTFHIKDRVGAALKREHTAEERKASRRRITGVVGASHAARRLGHVTQPWTGDDHESVSACRACGALGYLDIGREPNVRDGELFTLACPAIKPQ